MPATSSRPRGCDVTVGIKRGRVENVRWGDGEASAEVVYEGSGGPGKSPVTADSETICASYRGALAGYPPAGRVAACVSGTSGQAQRRQIADLLTGRFPGADVKVVPDYVGRFPRRPRGDRCLHRGTNRLGGVQQGR